MTTLLDLNAEPAVADLSRQILSEAKLWEAIQEARDEMGRRHKEVRSGTSPSRSWPRRRRRRPHAAFRMWPSMRRSMSSV